MPISINYNRSSEVCRNHLEKAINVQNNSLERLITGCRINASRDDAAGLSIATNLDIKIRSITQAQQNTQLGISYVELASEAIKIMQANVQRLRDLAEQATNEILAITTRDSIQLEADEIIESINKTKDSTDFNGIKVFETIPTPTNINLQFGTNSDSTSILNIESGFEFESTDIDFSTSELSKKSLDTIDSMSQTLIRKDADFGTYTSNLNTALESLVSQATSLIETKSLILDADMAKESANYVKSNILTSFGTQLLNLSNTSTDETFKLISAGKTSGSTISAPKDLETSTAVDKSSANGTSIGTSANSSAQAISTPSTTSSNKISTPKSVKAASVAKKSSLVDSDTTAFAKSTNSLSTKPSTNLSLS